MANHISHAALPFPVKGARFTLMIPYLDADGDPTDPTTPDTEISKDGAAFADCAEEATTITGGNGSAYITLSGAELDCVLAQVAAKVASGPKATLITLYPRVLPMIFSVTASAGTAGSITLPATVPAIADLLNGCIVRTTGGTGGGGVGGANNQARVITAYSSGRVATVVPNWEVIPDNTTTVEILLTEMALLRYADLKLLAGDAAAASNLSKSAGVLYAGSVTSGGTTTKLRDAALPTLDTDHLKGRIVIFTTGNLKYQATDITAYDQATKELTFTAVTQAPANGTEFVIV